MNREGRLISAFSFFVDFEKMSRARKKVLGRKLGDRRESGLKRGRE